MSNDQNIFTIEQTWQALEIQGPEAKDFLQRVTSANFKFLRPGSFTPGTLLAPTGKIVLYFKALHFEPARYLFLIPSDGSAKTAAETGYDALEKIHFRENFTITNASEKWTYIRVLLSDETKFNKLVEAKTERGALTSLTADHSLLMMNESRWNIAPIQFDLGFVVQNTALSQLVAKLKQTGIAEVSTLEPYRVRAGDPRVPNELTSNTIPLEAHLDDAVHENKGCYPGQEVIERIRAMGQVPRTLVVVRGTGATPKLPSKILTQNKEEAGALTSAEKNVLDEGWIGLAFIKRAFAKPETSFDIDGNKVTVEFK